MTDIEEKVLINNKLLFDTFEIKISKISYSYPDSEFECDYDITILYKEKPYEFNIFCSDYIIYKHISFEKEFITNMIKKYNEMYDYDMVNYLIQKYDYNFQYDPVTVDNFLSHIYKSNR